MSDFVHLHCHSEYSLLDGMPKVDEYIIRVNEMGHPGFALTEHGNMRSVYQAHVRTKAKFAYKGVEYDLPPTKPVFGIEFYVAPWDHTIKGAPESIKAKARRLSADEEQYRLRMKKVDKQFRMRYHVLAFAMNNQGLESLYKLNHIAWRDGFYYRPRVDFDLLKKYNEGLIITTSCLSGPVPEMLVKDRQDEAIQWVKSMQEVFGDRLYLEIQPHSIEDQVKVNYLMESLADETKIPIIATNDTHYIDKLDSEAHEVLLAIQSNASMKATDRWRFDDSQFYMKTRQEMLDSFKANNPNLSDRTVEDALSNTMKVFDRCNAALVIDRKKGMLPNVPMPAKFKSDKDYFLDIIKEGWKWRDIKKLAQDYSEHHDIGYDEAYQMYKDRLKLEIDRIFTLKFEKYFLIIRELIYWARSQDIMVGPGRGSSSASLVCYLMGITSIDPIKYDLLFDRFLSITRIDYPDVDMDFEDARRQEVIQHLFDLYGEENTSQIGTVGKMKGKQALKDVGRVFDVPHWETNEVTKHIIERSSGDARSSQTVEDSFKEFDVCREYNERHPEVLKFVIKLEGKAKQVGIHAAGVQIAPDAIDKYVPIEYREYKADGEKRRVKVAAWDWMECQGVGLVKMDVLGLKTLSILKLALNTIKERHGVDIDLERVDLEDKNVLQSFTDTKFVGIFQYDSIGMTKTCEPLTFTQFEDIIALNALYRPGAMRSGLATHFINRKIGKEKVKKMHPIYDEITKTTEGILVYQEQLIKCFIQLANYDPGTADELRKKVAKSHGVEVISKEGEAFIKGAVANGMDKDEAAKLFENMAFFGSYAFNKAHAAAYGVIAQWGMYLKTYYPTEFFYALMRYEKEKDEIIRFVVEARKTGINVRTPDINDSQVQFSIAPDDSIISGLVDIKGVGIKASEAIVAGRGDTPFADIADFAKRVDRRVVNRGVIGNLFKAGAFMSLYPNLVACVQDIEVQVMRRRKQEDGKFKQVEVSETKQLWEFLLDDYEKGVELYNEYSQMDCDEEDMVTIMSDLCPIPPFKHKTEYYHTVTERLRVLSKCKTADYSQESVALFGTLVDIKYNNIGDFHKEEPDEQEKKRIGWGKRYANVNIEDETGIVRVNVDANVFPTFRHIIDRGMGTPVWVYGRTFFGRENVFCDVMVDGDELRRKLESGGTTKDKLRSMTPHERFAIIHPCKLHRAEIDSKMNIRGGTELRVSAVKEVSFKKPLFVLNGLIIRVKEHWTKKGKLMAFVDMEDETGRMNFIVWPEQFRRIKAGLVPGNVVQIRLTKQKDGFFVADNPQFKMLKTLWKLKGGEKH